MGIVSVARGAIALFSCRRWCHAYFRESFNALGTVVSPEYAVVLGAALLLVMPWRLPDTDGSWKPVS